MSNGHRVVTKVNALRVAVVLLFAASVAVTSGSLPALGASQRAVQADATAMLSDPPGGGAGSTRLRVQVSGSGSTTTLDALWSTYTCVDDAGTTRCSYTERSVAGATPTRFVFPVASSLRPPSSASVAADVTYDEIQWTCTTTGVSHSCTEPAAAGSGTTHIELTWAASGRTTNGTFTDGAGQRYVQRIVLATAQGEAFGITYGPEGNEGSSLGTTVAV